MSGPALTRTGFYGKLPARGDFVSVGLPRSFTDRWDGWLQSVLPASRVILGEGWLAAWLEGPIWRFAMPAGTCGPHAVLGLWMPSVDRAGRHFPLAFAHLGDLAELFRTGGSFLAEAEQAGLAALENDLLPEQVAARLGGPDRCEEVDQPMPAGDAALWWTDGAPLRPALAMTLRGLPAAATFAAMLDARAAVSATP